MLNDTARQPVDKMIARADDLRLASRQVEGGGLVIDCGIDSPGGLEAGLSMARVCLAGLGTVSLHPGEVGGRPMPVLQVFTDQPVAACLASQYAGWAVQADDYFAMGSGPMRAAYGGEELFDTIGMREAATSVIGVLETRTIPTPKVVELIASKTGVDRRAVTLLVAPTASLAGGAQVIARSVETALHKLHALGFDLTRVSSGWGAAPLPPVAGDDLRAIGRTNDCVLYGGRVVLWVSGDDDSLKDVGPRVPAAASPDHGAPFLEIFERYDRDFYKIDPLLFSPAQVVFQNIDTGRSHCFGERDDRILERSLFS